MTCLLDRTEYGLEGRLSMRIEVKYYYWHGPFYQTVTYPTVVDAFNALIATGMNAIAHPEGTTSGAYDWRADQYRHTLEGFKAKMDMCCNDPAEYSRRLHEAGYF